MYSWGRGDCDRLGFKSPLKLQNVPRLLDLPHRVSKLSLGTFHVLALTEESLVYAWGSGISGQLGLEKIANDVTAELKEQEPQLIKALTPYKIVAVATGSKHSLAVSAAGQVFAWGCNRYGQIGQGRMKRSARPLPVEACGAV